MSGEDPVNGRPTSIPLSNKLESEFEPIITLLDFNDIIVLDLEQSPIQNGLRNYEFLTVAGFRGGEIYVTLKFK